MAISTDEKVHIMTRRQFEGDLRRHFAGVVTEVSNSVIRVRGFAFIFDSPSGEFVRRRKERTRVFSLTDAGLIINVLPGVVDIDSLRYAISENGMRIVTDGKGFEMNVTEFGASI